MKIIALLGPTSSGKTAVALELAKALNIEIINFDVYQMYKHFNIGVGKISKKEQEQVRHHFLDTIEPNNHYTIYQFQKECRDILNKEGLIIMTGGSNLYLNAVIYDYQFAEEKEQSSDFSLLTNEELMEQLKLVDSASAQAIHVNNRRRLIRALNVYTQSQKTLSRDTYKKDQPLFPVKFFVLRGERELLYKKAEERFEEMIEEGLVEEVQFLKEHYSLDALPFKAIGYQEISDYLDGTISLQQAKEKAQQRTRNYIRRQLTWLNNQYAGVGIDIISEQPTIVAQKIIKMLKEEGWID